MLREPRAQKNLKALKEPNIRLPESMLRSSGAKKGLSGEP
jgi:hypothetical protein